MPEVIEMFDLISRKEPSQPLRRREDINDLFDRFFEPTAPFGSRSPAPLTPEVDVSESKATIYVQAELPGMGPEDINVSLKGNLLTIQGQKRKETEEQQRSFYRVERQFGSFSRTVPLPTDVEEKGVCATYKNGVLKIVLPKTKAAQEKGRRIAVEAK